MATNLTQFVQGLGSVGADTLNGFVQSCDTIAVLQNFTGVTGNQVYVRGGQAIGDGEQGNFYWNATSTANPDGINIIQPFGAPFSGRWIRLFVTTFPGPYANDAAAATAGVLIDQAYLRADGVVAWRMS